MASPSGLSTPKPESRENRIAYTLIPEGGNYSRSFYDDFTVHPEFFACAEEVFARDRKMIEKSGGDMCFMYTRNLFEDLGENLIASLPGPNAFGIHPPVCIVVNISRHVNFNVICSIKKAESILQSWIDGKDYHATILRIAREQRHELYHGV